MSQFELFKRTLKYQGNTNYDYVYQLRGLAIEECPTITVEELLDLTIELNKVVKSIKDERKQMLEQHLSNAENRVQLIKEQLNQLEQL